MKFFIALVSFSILATACNFGGRGSSYVDPNKKFDQDRIARLKVEFEAIKGTYEGKLKRSLDEPDEANADPTDRNRIQLKLSYAMEATERRDIDGLVIYEPRPTARLSFLNDDEIDANMVGTFDDFLGEFVFETRKTANGGTDGVHYRLRGTIIGETLRGVLQSGAGIEIGPVYLVRQTTDVSTPREQDQAQYDRLEAALQPYVGQFLGEVFPDDPSFKKFTIGFVFVIEDTVANGMLRPVLMARARRTDGLSVAWRYTISIRDTVSPPLLNLTPLPGARGYAEFTLTASFVINPKTKKAELEGRITFPTFAGDFKAVRN